MTKNRATISPKMPLKEYPIAPDFEMTARIVFGRGIFDRRSFKTLMKHTKHHNTVIEVGSHVGSWTLGFSKIFKHVVGFEPQPTNRAYLKRNIARAANTGNIIIHPTAITNDLTKQFCISASKSVRNSGMAHLIPKTEANDNNPDVKCARLDDILKPSLPKGSEVNALKIDVEGLELDVLRSGIETIQRFLPTILLEINQSCARYGTTHENIYDFMSDQGYKKAEIVRNDHIFIPK